MFIARINITLKESVLDPQGSTVKKVLENMDEKDVVDVRIGKYVELKLDTKNVETAAEDVQRLCDKLLVNHVIETFDYQLEEV